MTVFSFYLFDRTGTCLFYNDWKRSVQPQDLTDDQKNMFGMLFALRNFSIKLSPDCNKPDKGTPTYFVTDVYALHYFETLSGLRFVLTTSNDFKGVDVANSLQEIYDSIYVELIAKNPLYVRGSAIKSQLFKARLDAFVRALPCF